MTVGNYQVGAPPAPPAPPRRNLLPWIAAAAVALLLVVGGAVAVTVFVMSASKPTPPAAGPATVTAYGQMNLSLGGFAWNRNPAECWGRGGYDDIREGVNVTVTDPEGKVVALGELAKGLPVIIDDRANSCLFRFEVEVPAGLKFYGIEVSHRGVIQFTQDELTGKGVTLTLG